MKGFNNPCVEGFLTKKKLLDNVQLIICPHLGTAGLSHAGQCMHNMDDQKDAEDVAKFKKITNHPS